jgi:hypothetical protein
LSLRQQSGILQQFVLGETMPPAIEDWKRVKALWREVIATVPRFPNR